MGVQKLTNSQRWVRRSIVIHRRLTPLPRLSATPSALPPPPYPWRRGQRSTVPLPSRKRRKAGSRPPKRRPG